VSSLSSYYLFYLIDKFGVRPRRRRSTCSFFLPPTRWGRCSASARDRFGRKYVIWFRSSARCRSRWRCAMRPGRQRVLTVFMAYHLVGDVVDHRVRAGTDAARFGIDLRVFFGFAFGIGGLGAAVLGRVADRPASRSSIRSALSCRRSACSRCSCRRCRERALTRQGTLRGSFLRLPSTHC